MGSQDLAHAAGDERARICGRRQRIASHARAHAREPERKPRTLETGVPSDEYRPPRESTRQLAERIGHYHTLQGGWPLAHNSFSF